MLSWQVNISVLGHSYTGRGSTPEEAEDRLKTQVYKVYSASVEANIRQRQRLLEVEAWLEGNEKALL